MDYGVEVSPAARKFGSTQQEIDSLSDDDDFSDDLSLVDSDDEKRFDLNRASPHNAIQVVTGAIRVKVSQFLQFL